MTPPRSFARIGAVICALGLLILLAWLATRGDEGLAGLASGGRLAAILALGALLFYTATARARHLNFFLHVGVALSLGSVLLISPAKNSADLFLARGETGALPEWAGAGSITIEAISVETAPLGGIAMMGAALHTGDGRRGAAEVNRPLEIAAARVHVTEAGPAIRITLRDGEKHSSFVAKYYPGQEDRFELDGFAPLIIRGRDADDLTFAYGENDPIALSSGETARWDAASIEVNELDWWIKLHVTSATDEGVVLAGFGILTLGLLLELAAATAEMRRRGTNLS